MRTWLLAIDYSTSVVRGLIKFLSRPHYVHVRIYPSLEGAMKLQFVPIIISKTKISDPGEKPWTVI